MLVVASLKSWDGTRILGVFDGEAIALEACNEMGIDTESEHFSLDFIEMNKISRCQTILVDHNSYGKSFRRVHVYENDNDQSKNITNK